jgi:hypothetical protein
MGADIHLYIEYKDENRKWVLDKNLKCKRCNGTGKNCDEIDIEDEDRDICFGDGYVSCDISRSYWLFAALANVRNRTDMIPIAEPRGIPEDASKEYIKIANNDLDDHSHSYHTLKQLKEYDCEYDGKRGWEYLKIYFPNTLQELADKHGGDENVRIVFFFDN